MSKLTYYYLYNPLTKQTKRFDKLTSFEDACRLASTTPGIWEVHVVKQK